MRHITYLLKTLIYLLTVPDPHGACEHTAKTPVTQHGKNKTCTVLWHCWLGSRKGIRPVKNGGWWRWALFSPDGVVPIRMVGMFAPVNLPLHHKVQKFSYGTGSPRWSRKKGRKMVVAVAVWLHSMKNGPFCGRSVSGAC